jgi:lipopolysaccharide export system protein LptA
MKTALLFWLFAAAALLRAAEAPAPETTITGQTMDMRSTATETTTIFDGAVKLVGTDITVTCDHLVVVSTSLGDKAVVLAPIDRFKSLVATGNVHIVQGLREATCGRAEIFPRDNQLILTEKPVVVDRSGPYVATGDRLNLLRGERRITGENVTVTGPPVKDLGPDSSPPRPPPGSAPSTTP